MEKLRFKAIVEGPKEYLKNGVLIEDFEITEQDIEDFLEEGEGETREEAIEYFKEEYCSAWEQRWCKVSLIGMDEFLEAFQKELKLRTEG